MDEDMAGTYLQVAWPEIVYSEDAGELSAPQVQQIYRVGSIVSSTFCPVTGKWHMLIAGIDGGFYAVTHDQEGLIQQWVTENVADD
jgi:hypothetical protein